MAGAVALTGWGLWCLLWAPGVAARYQRNPRDRADFPDLHIVSPREWRYMGGVWVAIGLCTLAFSV